MTAQVMAAVYRGNRSLELQAQAVTDPGPGEVRVQTAYCGICGTDLHVFHGTMEGRTGRNRVIGHETSGTVDAVGDGVTRIKPGQRIVVRPQVHCGNCPACRSGHINVCHNLRCLGVDVDGAMRGAWNVPESVIHPIPEHLTMKRAALIEPVAVACHALRVSELRPDELAVVIGCGPIGILVAMVARNTGARVLISEVNRYRLETASNLGFETIDPAEQDLPDRIAELTCGRGADVVFEVSGTQQGIDAMTQISSSRGRIVMVAIHTERPVIDMFRFFWRELRLAGSRVYLPEDFEQAIGLVADGGMNIDPIISGIHPLQTIQSTFDWLDSAPATMKNLIGIGQDC